MDIKLIALDLDGTLLNSSKEITERSLRALTMAAEKGIHIVPCTGRLAMAIPQEIRELPFVRYMVCVNGSRVVDKQTSEILYRAEIPVQTALAVMRVLDEIPCIYDCYIDGKGWMSKHLYERIPEFADSDYILQFIRATRTPVDELKQYVQARADDVQKVQLFLRTDTERDLYKKKLQEAFTSLVVCSSFGNNIELNCKDATKGAALRALCAHLGIDTVNAAAFGDADNDVSMLETVGCGVAMGNAFDSVKKAAFAVTAGCDDDGVAQYIEQYIL